MPTMKEALKRAQAEIYVSYCGGYYVSKPFYGLADIRNNRCLPLCTTDYFKARLECRFERIGQAIRLITGDSDYALKCQFAVENSAGDWREIVRDCARQYKANNQ